MAVNLSITAVNVGIAELAAAIKPAIVGEAVTQGHPLWFNVATNKWMQGDADADPANSASAEIGAIALSAGAGDGAIVTILTRGRLNLGATLAGGKAYYLSPDKGGICREDQLTTGHWVTLLGVADSATIFNFDPKPYRIKVPA